MSQRNSQFLGYTPKRDSVYPHEHVHAYLSAYRNVFRVCSLLELLGEMVAIMHVLELPMNESFKTYKIR